MNRLILFFFFVLVALAMAIVRTRLKARRLSRLSWEDLLVRIEPVPMDAISEIASDYLHPRKGQLQLDAARLWPMIGEAEGLRKMYTNAQVLIALAGYAQRWNRTESLIVAERMRRDAVTLRRAALRLSLGLVFGYDRLRGPFCIQEAASAYYLMRARVLALYETSHAGRLPKLVAAL